MKLGFNDKVKNAHTRLELRRLSLSITQEPAKKL